jgi:hypothetical protein
MIGVVAPASQHDVAAEFFELFKTPWEFWVSGRHYDVALCCGEGEPPANSARLLVIYSGARTAETQRAGDFVTLRQAKVPVYGRSVTFADSGSTVRVTKQNGRTVARIGYDLFEEVRALLTSGQPIPNGASPTLEQHIANLRELITSSGIRVVEIPPVPYGHQFTACLTHDLDHPSLLMHKWDHTMFGFLYRAILGSARDVFKKRRSIGVLLRNWIAALKLPLVHLGVVTDFWSEFDRYCALDRGRSTFFAIPFAHDPGQWKDGRAPQKRASGYGIADIAGRIRDLASHGYEIGLHGIDAWCDSARGTKELQTVRRVTGSEDIGVRMHWLYRDESSLIKLEEAGADYDSTVGYNETIGYRAGTTQVYKPLETTRLMELPLHVMDTALFYPRHLHLKQGEAAERVSVIIDNAVAFGGCVTVNWHDRSLAPERLWGDFYAEFVAELESKGAWFATASQAVAWFRKRRAARFEIANGEPHGVRVRMEDETGANLPDLQLRIHNGESRDIRLNPRLDSGVAVG